MTSKPTTRPTLLERETSRGAYDMQRETLIVDHPEHGWLLLVEGFGGVDSLQGGAYRWEHGAAYRLQPGDTLGSLRAIRWNEAASAYDAVLAAADPSRPVLHWWSGTMIRAAAEAALA